MAIPPAHTLNFSGVLSESKRIINAHSRHFLALSVLFLLPLSFSLIIYPTLHLPVDRPDVLSGQFFVGDYSPESPQTLLFPLIYTIAVFLLSICAIATITYSTHHGFYGRPVKFFPAIKSLIFSFFPLVSTAIAAKFFICLISLSFVMFVTVILKLGQNLGFAIDFNSSYFIWFFAFLGLIWGLITVYFQVNWCLASVIVVAESKWGFEPLRRSSYLVKGMRSVSLSLLFVLGVMIAIWVWMTANSVLNFDFDAIDGWRSLDFVLQTIISSSFLSFVIILLLHYIAANTVLYMYCKALHGELAVEIAEEFACEYVSLPFDDSKVPHVVTVLTA